MAERGDREPQGDGELEEARAELEHLRALLANLPAGVYRTTPDGRLLRVNRAAARIFGYDGETDLLGRSVLDLYFDPADRTSALEQLDRDGSVNVLELRLRRKDGSAVWAAISARAVKEGGRVAWYDGIVVDISDRKRTEEALHLSEARLRATIESLPFDFFSLDESGRYVLANSVCRRHGGELLGLRPEDVAPDPATLALWLENNRRAFAGETVDGEVEFAVDGVPGHFHNIISPIRDRGRICGILGINIDITAQKQAEEERRRIEAQALDAQKLESLGMMAGGIAHDFNNLVMGILGNVDLALAHVPDASPVLPYLRGIEIAARRSADLANQLLAYSGRGRLEVEPVDLSAAVSEIAHLLEVTVSRRATLEVDLARGLPPVVADPSQIRQVIMNLITNASESLGEEGGRITVRTGVTVCDRESLAATFPNEGLAEGCYVFLEVTDTGCGMDEEVRRRVFEPFFSTKLAGRGLGMAAVLGIVRRHGGSILLDSAAGRGTMVRVLLSCAAPEVAAGPGPTAGSGWRGSGLVLVADDDDGVRLVTAEMLKLLGFEVLLAGDGEEAVTRFAEHAARIRVVLLDLVMPRLGGLEALRRMLAIRPDARVILASGLDELEATRRVSGPVDFIQKPYTLDDLRARLRRVLGDDG